MDERLLFDRFHSAFDVEIRPDFRERIRARLLASEARPYATPRLGRSRQIASQSDVSAQADRGAAWQFGAPSLRWAVGLVAVLVTVALLASLLYSRGALNRLFPTQPFPAGQPACLSAPTPAAQLPFASGELQAVTGLSDPELMTPFDLEATIAAMNITLVRGYADPLTTVLIFKMGPTDGRVWTLDLMHDDQGEKIPGGTGVYMSADQYEALVFTLPGPKGYGADGIAHLEVWFGLLSAALPSDGIPVEDTAAGKASLTFSLCVHPAASLSVPPRFRLGPGTVTMQSLEITPAALRMRAVADGLGDPPLWTGGNFSNLGLYRIDPPCPSFPDTNVLDTTCLIDFTTGLLGPQFGPLQGTAYDVDVGWLRPAAGKYRLVFRSNGATHGVDFRVPPLANP